MNKRLRLPDADVCDVEMDDHGHFQCHVAESWLCRFGSRCEDGALHAHYLCTHPMRYAMLDLPSSRASIIGHPIQLSLLQFSA